LHGGTGRVLITGGAGLLGGTLIATRPAAFEVHATQRRTPVHRVPAHDVELSNRDAACALFRSLQPQLVIHTAYSVQHGERDISLATEAVVAACRESSAQLIYMSTDALLDGEHSPYDESAEPAPVHEYGQMKAQAEERVRRMMPGAAVIRTSLITRFDPPDPRCAWVADALRDGEPISLLTDELRCPIAVEDLAAQIWEIAALPRGQQAGVWNLAGPQAVSRYELGQLIAAYHGLDPAGLTPMLSAELDMPRPRDLRLTTARADRELSVRARPISEVAASRRSVDHPEQ
jgi:dTDP-4-dehydrorhamnose reductase